MKNLLLCMMGTIALASVAGNVQASDRNARYEVTITNITKAQTFTPQLVVTHSPAVRLFELGAPASEQLAVLAEDGSPVPLTEVLQNAGDAVSDVQTIAGLLAPGSSATVIVDASSRHQFLSVAAMLIPTNDTFMALNLGRLPLHGSATYHLPAYDAGSEPNDQDCANIPGPRCGGQGSSLGTNPGDEGFVHIGNGFHELGATSPGGSEVLGPLAYDWRNPVALVTVRRVR